MINIIKVSFLTIIILFSGIFVSILAEDNTLKEDFFSKTNTKPKLIAYISILKKSYDVELIEKKYDFKLNKCKEIIKRKLPFQKEYIQCEKKIIKVREDLI